MIFWFHVELHQFKTGTKLIDLIRRPQLNYEVLTEVDPGRRTIPKLCLRAQKLK